MLKINENKSKILALLGTIKRPGMKELIEFLNRSDYFIAPASSRFHLKVEGGLAQHSLNVFVNLKALNEMNNEVIGPSSVILCALMHDFCKIGNYQENILKSGNVSAAQPYALFDNLLTGHGERSVIELLNFVKLNNSEKIMIRWHMGPYDHEFKTYEEKLKKKYPEVFLMHMADQMANVFQDTWYEETKSSEQKPVEKKPAKKKETELPPEEIGCA